MTTDVHAYVVSEKRYILLWILTMLAPFGLQYTSLMSPLWLASIRPPDVFRDYYIIDFFLLGIRIFSEGSSYFPEGLFTLWIAIPSFYANINIWNLDRKKNNPIDASWMAWLTPIVYYFVFTFIIFSDFITMPLPIPITAVVQYLLFKRIYNRTKHNAESITN